MTVDRYGQTPEDHAMEATLADAFFAFPNVLYLLKYYVNKCHGRCVFLRISPRPGKYQCGPISE